MKSKKKKISMIAEIFGLMCKIVKKYNYLKF